MTSFARDRFNDLILLRRAFFKLSLCYDEL